MYQDEEDRVSREARKEALVRIRGAREHFLPSTSSYAGAVHQEKMPAIETWVRALPLRCVLCV